MTRRDKLMAGVAAALLLVLAGIAVWQRVRADRAESRLDGTRQELLLQRQESTLALAAIEAGRGSYELARQLASDFFTNVQAALPRTAAQTRPILEEILLQRDAMITALSRSDPQAAPQLVRLLIRYRVALGEPVGPRQPAASPAPGPPPAPDSAMPG